MKPTKRWEYSIGMLPHRVEAYEDTRRAGVVTLRWKAGPDRWTRRSLGFAVRVGSRLDAEHVERARHEAEIQYRRLIGQVPEPERGMTLAEGVKLITDPERGRYPKATAHRHEVERCLKRVMATLGRDRPFSAIERGDVRTVWRAELKRQQAAGNAGHRSAELLVSRLFTVADWLRDEQKIAEGACRSWKKWREEFAVDCGEIVIQRPRHSLEEFRALLAAAPKVDPRFALLFTLGAEFRLGQVRRITRKCVSTDVTSRWPHGCFLVKGSGKKRGTLVAMTAGQRDEFDEAVHNGYLEGLEVNFDAKTIDDYPIFPGGKIRRLSGNLGTDARHASRPPIDPTQIRTWFNECERLANIPHVAGRGWYGSRRIGVDGAKAEGISREGLQKWGGWSDTQVPDMIYADQEAQAAVAEAATVRAKVRGET